MLNSASNILMSLSKGLTRYQKRALLVCSDLVLLNFALWASMSLRFGVLYVAPKPSVALLLILVPAMAVAAFFYFGLYRHVTRHFNAAGDKLIVQGVVGASVCLGLGTFILGADGIPRTVLVIFPIIGSLLISASRRLVGYLIARAGVFLPPAALPDDIRNVVIYGAGDLTNQLIQVIRTTPNLETAGIVDPDPTLWRQLIGGVRVHPPEKLAQVIRANNVSQVILATHNTTRKQRLDILNLIGKLPVEVRVMPQAQDILSGRLQVSDLRRVDASDLLGRAPIPPDPRLMAGTIDGKSIMVTGAGGSIGSELVRQIIKYAPRQLVLLESSESALYEIESFVGIFLRDRKTHHSAPRIVSVLGSVLDQGLVEKSIRENGVESIFHAAAYKHLPIVERNAVSGASNNVIGTEVVARAAMKYGVRSFVLISTDKAVHPTSVMGASKRFAELVLQMLARETSSTTFCTVRFGNVLDSSGSVVPLFRKQIEAGGPLTVTHAEAVRYFISIPEAAELVIQASAMATGGEVFALDMGEPVRIVELARMMIRLSGLKLKDAENPDGQIEIKFTGLRPGEKLAEELYISDRVSTTAHSRIQRVQEPAPPPDYFWAGLEQLKRAISSDDDAAARRVLFSMAARDATAPAKVTADT